MDWSLRHNHSLYVTCSISTRVVAACLGSKNRVLFCHRKEAGQDLLGPWVCLETPQKWNLPLNQPNRCTGNHDISHPCDGCRRNSSGTSSGTLTTFRVIRRLDGEDVFALEAGAVGLGRVPSKSHLRERVEASQGSAGRSLACPRKTSEAKRAHFLKQMRCGSEASGVRKGGCFPCKPESHGMKPGIVRPHGLSTVVVMQQSCKIQCKMESHVALCKDETLLH